MEVMEDCAARIVFNVKGSPQPSAELTWSHIGVAVPYQTKNVSLGNYSCIYTINMVGSNYCGRTLKMQAINHLAKSPFKGTKFIVLCKYCRLYLLSTGVQVRFSGGFMFQGPSFFPRGH